MMVKSTYTVYTQLFMFVNMFLSFVYNAQNDLFVSFLSFPFYSFFTFALHLWSTLLKDRKTFGIDFPRYNMKCSGENLILRGIFHVVSRLVFLYVHFMLHRGNLDCFSNSVCAMFVRRLPQGWQVLMKSFNVLKWEIFQILVYNVGELARGILKPGTAAASCCLTACQSWKS